jgi:hypothetical protein
MNGAGLAVPPCFKGGLRSPPFRRAPQPPHASPAPGESAQGSLNGQCGPSEGPTARLWCRCGREAVRAFTYVDRSGLVNDWSGARSLRERAADSCRQRGVRLVRLEAAGRPALLQRRLAVHGVHLCPPGRRAGRVGAPLSLRTATPAPEQSGQGSMNEKRSIVRPNRGEEVPVLRRLHAVCGLLRHSIARSRTE